MYLNNDVQGENELSKPFLLEDNEDFELMNKMDVDEPNKLDNLNESLSRNSDNFLKSPTGKDSLMDALESHMAEDEDNFNNA